MSAYLPFFSISSRWLPLSAILPSSIKRILSQNLVEASLWETKTEVFPYVSSPYFS